MEAAARRQLLVPGDQPSGPEPVAPTHHSLSTGPPASSLALATPGSFLLGCAAVCSDHIPDPALCTLPLLQGRAGVWGTLTLQEPLLTQLFHLPSPAQSLQTQGGLLSACLPPSRHPERLLAPSLCLSLVYLLERLLVSIFF